MTIEGARISASITGTYGRHDGSAGNAVQIVGMSMDLTRMSVLVFVAGSALADPVISPFSSPTITGEADISGPCSKTTTLIPGETISCSWQAQYGQGLFLTTQASASFSGGMLTLSATALSDPGGASAVAMATYDQWFVITGGSGSDILRGSWVGGGGSPGYGYADVVVDQGGVDGSGNGVFRISSPFVYGVPFEIKATIHAYASPMYFFDGVRIRAGWDSFLGFTTQACDPIVFGTAVPEPATYVVGFGLCLLPFVKRILGTRISS